MSKTGSYSIGEMALAFIGTGIAGSIYFAHRANIELPCSTGNGCDLVNASHWSHVAGIPIALIGLVGYAVLVLLSALKLYAETPSGANTIRWVMLATALGASCYSWYLQYVAAVYIGVMCIWCRASAITMTILLITLIAEQVNASRNNPAAAAPAGAAPNES